MGAYAYHAGATLLGAFQCRCRSGHAKEENSRCHQQVRYCCQEILKNEHKQNRKFIMRLIEWEVGEEGYEEQINIPKEQRDLAKAEGISTDVGQKIAVTILNLNTGESYTNRLAITGSRQIYLPVEIQKMLKGSGKIRIQILGG